MFDQEIKTGSNKKVFYIIVIESRPPTIKGNITKKNMNTQVDRRFTKNVWGFAHIQI